jgi:trimeric autotransporter adhesin
MYASPRSNPVLSNFTILGAKGGAAKGGSALFRAGTAVDMQNSIFSGAKKGCIDIDDAATTAQGGIQFIGNFLHCAKAFEAENDETWSVADYFTYDNFNETTVDPMLNGYAPQAGSPVTGLGDVTPFGDARYGTFFDSVDYAGAVKDEADAWYKGWTNLARD